MLYYERLHNSINQKFSPSTIKKLKISSMNGLSAHCEGLRWEKFVLTNWFIDWALLKPIYRILIVFSDGVLIFVSFFCHMRIYGVKKPLVRWNEGSVPFSSLYTVICTILSYQPWGRWIIGMLEHYRFVLSCLIFVPLVRFIKNILFVDVMEVHS